MRWCCSSNKMLAKVLLEIDDLADFTRYDWAMVRGCFCGGGTRASSFVSCRLIDNNQLRHCANKQAPALHNTNPATSTSPNPLILHK